MGLKGVNGVGLIEECVFGLKRKRGKQFVLIR